MNFIAKHFQYCLFLTDEMNVSSSINIKLNPTLQGGGGIMAPPINSEASQLQSFILNVPSKLFFYMGLSVNLNSPNSNALSVLCWHWIHQEEARGKYGRW